MSLNNCGDDFLSKIYHALRTPRRRYVIELVAESDDELSVRMLAKEITAQEKDVTLEHATGEPYRNTYNALSQTHLDTLSEADIIIYDSKRQTVAPGPNLMIALLLSNLNQAAFHTLRDYKSGDVGERDL